MSDDFDFTVGETTEKVEAKDFELSKKEVDEVVTEKESKKEKHEEAKELKAEAKDGLKTSIFAKILTIGWNVIATQRGYEPVYDSEAQALEESLLPVENELNIADKMGKHASKITAGATIVSVFAPKIIKKRANATPEQKPTQTQPNGQQTFSDQQNNTQGT